MAMTPKDVLAEDQRQAIAAARKMGVERVQALLQKSARELEYRLHHAEGLRGHGKDSFTASQLRSAIAQVHAVMQGLTHGMAKELPQAGAEVAGAAAANALRYLQSAEKHFTGSSRPLRLDEAAIFDAAASGARSTVLRRLATSGEIGGVEGTHHAKQGILERYGLETIGHFEGVMKKALITRAPWEDVKKQLVEKSPFLQGAPAFWAERIARTETMGAHNRAHWESIQEASEQLGGGMVKILAATFDDRTAADSYAVHGQIRRPEEPFESWFGLYQHPPNRPNDREVVVPHRIEWPIPPYLAWKSDSQIAERWKYDGRKGSPPPRPKMTTVPLEEFGKPQAKPEPQNQDHGEPEIPGRAPKEAQAPVEEAQWHDYGIPEVPPRGPHALVAAAEEAEFEKPPAPPPPPEPVHIPEPEPEPPRPELTAAEVLATKDAGAKGSNEGGFYTGSDGVQRYVKFYGDPSQAYSEHLTNQIYRDLGFLAPDSVTFEHNGKRAYASTVVKDLKTVKEVGLDAPTAKKVMEGFAADVLTGNWDAVGTGLDNVGHVAAYDDVMRVDNGGSLLFRAKAGRKSPDVLNQITEWDGFFNSGKNPYYAQVASAAGVTKASQVSGIIGQIDAIKNLRKESGGWAKYIEKHAPGMPSADKKQVAAMLEARTKLLAAKVKSIKDDVKADKLAAKQAKLNAKLAAKQAKEFKALSKKLGGAPPQTYETLHTDVDAQQKHIHSKTNFGMNESDYRRLAEAKVRTAKGKTAVERFTASSSTCDEIRAHERNPSAHAKDTIKQHAKDLEQFFATAEKAPPGTIYRGIHSLSDETIASFLREPLFSFNATTSMSRAGETAQSFGSGLSRKGTLLFVINHKTGVPVETISMHTEYEVFLAKGTTFKVTKRYLGKGGSVVIEADELTGADLAKAQKAHEDRTKDPAAK